MVQTTEDSEESDGKSLLELRWLGTSEVFVGGKPLPPLRYRKDLWLLAYLTLHRERPIPRQEIAALFWPDAAESQALYSLRRSLSNLRRALGREAPRLLAPSPSTVRLDLTEAACDLVAFEAALARTAGSTDPEERLRQAVRLYGGPLLPDCREEWADAPRAAREQSYLSALERLARITQEKGQPAEAAGWLRLLLATDPYRETAFQSLMQALADCGDRAAVTQVYREQRLRLHRDLNASPAPETVALYESLLAKPARTAVLPPAAPPVGPPRHLPVPLSDLFGREKVVEEAAGWLGKHRLATLVGTGGIGKTRLSIAVADRVIGQFPGGVWFVDLAPLSDAALLVPTVLQRFGVPESPKSTPIETLEQALASQTLLLILDNCEHLLEACASLVYRLLSACPNLRVLATSREALRLAGEHLYPVPALTLPPTSEEIGEGVAASLLEYGAVRLFVERAKQSSPSFRLTLASAGPVVRICHSLDGIPLAIELAAARLRSMTVEDLEKRLSDRFRLLTGGSRTDLPRQQTLRALIDWSYDLLDDQQKALLCRLSVFAGGWTLEAAEAVGVREGPPGSGIEDWEVLDLLAALVDKSLVVYEEGADGQARYRLLETIRHYSRERLTESGEEAEARRRHLDFFLALAEESEPRLFDQEQQDCAKRLRAEADNLRAAMAESRSDTQAALRFAGALRMYWIFTNSNREGLAHVAAALALPGASERTAARAGALIGAAFLSDAGEAGSWLAEGLSIARAVGDDLRVVWALLGMGDAMANQGDFKTAQVHLAESLALCETMGYWPGTLWALNYRGMTALKQDDATGARHHWERAVSLAREGRFDSRICWTLNYLARLHRDEGRSEKALSLARESLELVRGVESKSDYWWTAELAAELLLDEGEFEEARGVLSEAEAFRKGEGWEEWLQPQIMMVRACLGMGDQETAQSYLTLGMSMAGSDEDPWLPHYLGDIALERGDGTRAARFYQDSLRRFRERQEIAGVFLALSGLSAACEGQRCARLHGAAQALTPAVDSFGGILKAHERQRQRYAAAVAASRVTLGDAAFSAARDAGAKMTLDAAVDL